MDNPKQAVITYNCNLCLKKRIAIIPQFLHLKVDERGLVELVDTHQCKDTDIKSIILYIDSNHDVRSQVNVSTDEDKEEKETEATLFAIPVPTKTELPRLRIAVDNGYNSKYIKELTVKDKLRHLVFTTESEQNNEDKLTAVSPLNYIEISINHPSGVDETTAVWWLENIANILEEVVYADEKIFTYLLSFIDSKISKKFVEDEIVEIDYLCNSHISIPMSTEKSIETYDQKENTLFGSITDIEPIYYLRILTDCLNNEKKTLYDIIESNKSKLSISKILSIFHTLIRNSLIKFEKLQFFTISG